MTDAMAIRDQLIALLISTFPELDGRVESRKADAVESFPAAAVYVPELTSEPAAMRGHTERTITAEVEIHRQGEDIEATLASNADAFEAAVFSNRSSFGTKRIHLSRSAIALAPDSRGTEGTLQLTFTPTTTRSL